MIDWNKVNKEDSILISQIVKRTAKSITINTLSLFMDISACHINNPLRLKDLLEAKDGDFWHDVTGISSHIDRESGQLKDCFSPRYSK